MNLMLTKTPAEDIKQHILPVVYNALDADSSQVQVGSTVLGSGVRRAVHWRVFYIQELCLAIIPSFAHLIDLQAMKYCILPRIKKICFETITLSVRRSHLVRLVRLPLRVLQVRINCLICLGKLVESLDKWVIIDEVLPLLQSIPSREPAVLMAILGIIKVVMSSSKSGGLPREILATKVIPFLVPISIETSLNLSQVRSVTQDPIDWIGSFPIEQFNVYMSTVKEMLQTIESEQRKKLEQLSQQTTK